MEKNNLEPPYVKKYGSRGDLQIWIVDSSYIRNNIEEEFTNFGQHYKFPFIPKLELWIEDEAEPDEIQFFIDHLLEEHKLMSQGATYAQAFTAASKIERSERRKSGDVERITKGNTILPRGANVHIKLMKKTDSGVEVWIVDGKLVRNIFDINFTQGGHEFVYEYVPDNEVWIDNDVKQYERGYVILHEIHERNRMMEGIPYSEAHRESSKLEFYCRHHSDELHDCLSDEGW